MKKRLLSLALCLALCLGLLPVGVLATDGGGVHEGTGDPEAASVISVNGTTTNYATLPAALNAARDGDTVNLLENHTTNWSDVKAGKEQMAVVKTRITLDLNGNTVDYLVVDEVISNEEGGILNSYDGNLTVQSSQSGGTAMDGQITTLKFVRGTLAVQDGVIIGSSLSSPSGLICEADSGTVTISGGMVYNATVGKGAAVTVSGGSMHQGQWINNGTLNITGGTFGSVKFYNNSGTIAISGGTFSTLQNLDNDSFQIAPMSLLAPGHAFYDTYNENTVKDGSRRDYLQNVTVKEHTHTMVNSKCACGYTCPHTEINSATGACTVCGKQFAASITEGDDVTYYDRFNDALVYAYKNDGCTLKLLADVTGEAGVMINNPFLFDLNGHNVYALSVDARATIKDSGTKKGKIGKVTVSTHKVTDLTLGDLLEEGYAFKYETGHWANDSHLQTSDGLSVTVEKAPIQSVAVYAKDKNNKEVSTIAYGTTGEVTLVSSCRMGETSGADLTYLWYKLEGAAATAPLEGATGANYTPPDNLAAGTHTYLLICTSHGYSKSAEITITVTPISLVGATVTVSNLTYNGNPQEPTVTVKFGDETLSRDNDYTVQVTKQTNAGSYKLTIKGEGNYSGEIKDVEWKIEPMKIDSVMVSSGISKTYDGTATVTKTAEEWAKVLTFKTLSASGVVVDVPSEAYTISDVCFVTKNAAGEYVASPEVGEKNIQFTVTFKNNNYVLQTALDNQPASSKTYNQSGLADFTITQATVTSPDEITQYVYNDLAKTYTLDLAALLPELSEGCEYGDIQYQGCDYHFTDSTYLDSNNGMSVSKEGILTLPTVSAHTSDVNTQIGTITVPVVTTNYQNFEFTIKVVISARIPLNASGVTVSASEITYGQTLNESKLTATGTMKHPGTGEEVKGTFAWTNPEAKPGAAGDYTASWTFTPASGYEKYATATGTVTIKVNKATPTFTAPTAQENLTYTGQEQALITAGMTDYGTMQYSLTESGTYNQDIPTGTDAGAYTVWYRVIGDANHNDTAPASVAVRIGKKPLTITGVTAESKPYDGTTNADISSVTFDNVTLNRGTDYTVTASFDDAGVGSGKNVTATVTLMEQAAKNYALEQSSFTTTGSITKAAIDPSDIQLYQTVFNDLAKTYKIDLNQFLDTILPEGGKYGDIQYGKPKVFMNSDYYPVGGATIGNGNLSLSINKAASSNQGDEIGTVTVQVETTNYQPFTLTIHVSLQDKLVPVLAEGNTVSASEITYGQTLADSKLTVNGTMKDPNTSATVDGTFTWTDDTIKPDANDRYEAEWTFTPAAGYEKYATATGTVTVKVKPAKLTVSVNASRMYYTGKAQIASIIASGQSVDSTPVTFTYSDKKDGNYTSGGPTFTDAGTYTVYYKAEAANHEPATGKFTVTIDPLPIRLLSVSSISKTYDGSADVTLTADKLTFFSKTANIKLPDTALSFSDAQFTSKQAGGSYLPSPEVGGGKALSFTMTLTSKNYVFEGESEGTTEVSDVFATDDANRFTITKVTAPGSGLRPAVTVINDLAKTYEMVLSNDYLPKLSSPCEYGNVSYSLGDTYLLGGYKDVVQAEVVEENGQYKLKLTVPAVNYNRVSSVGTLRLYVSSDNYQDFPLDIGVKAKNKDVPVPDGPISASDITYGQALNDSKIAGKMKAGSKAIDGTFTWTNGTFKPAAGDYPASWTFTPAEGYEEYATATGTATVTVNPKAVTVSGITANGKVYDGTTNAVLDYSNAQFDGILENDKLTVAAKGVFEKAEAGKQNVAISDLTLVGNSANNYVLAESGNQTETTATITAKEVIVTITPNGGTYGSVTAAAAKLSGAVEGDNVPVTLTYTGNGYNSTAVPTNAGSYTVTASIADSNYVLTGETTANFVIEPKSIKDAKVVLGKGLIANGAEQTQTVEKVLLDGKELPADSYTVTDNTATAPGSHTLTITAKGNYTGTVKQTYVIVPAKAEDAPDKEITIGNGKVKVDIKFEGTVPPASQPTDKAELLSMLVDSGDITADELAQIADGANVDIVLTVKEANDPGEVKTAMAQAAKDYTIGQYLDISLLKYMTVNGSQQTAVALHTTKDALTISVGVPDALINTNSAVNRTYCIVRNHKGTIDVLDAAFDAAGKTLTFKTDRFSIYAIAYKDTAVPSSGSNPGSNNSSNDSETKKNEVAAPTPAPTPASTSKPSTITAMPQTGDTSNPTLYVVLLVASLLGLAVVFVCKKRNDK